MPLPVNPSTYLNVTNATADTLNYFINGTRQNDLSAIYPGGSTYYMYVVSGTQNYSFKKQGSSAVLFSTTYKLDTAVRYSIFIGGESADKTFLVADQLVNDTISNTAAVRFVHAAPAIEPLDFKINTGDTVYLKNYAFKSASPFMLATASTITPDTIRVYQSGTTTPIVDTTFLLEPGESYTIFAKGVLNGKGNAAFGVVLLTNTVAPTN